MKQILKLRKPEKIKFLQTPEEKPDFWSLAGSLRGPIKLTARQLKQARKSFSSTKIV